MPNLVNLPITSNSGGFNRSVDLLPKDDTNRQAIKFEYQELNDKEKQVLLALMVTDNDEEALALSPVRRRQFARLKRKVLPLKDKIRGSIENKSWEMLTGYVLKAIKVLGGHLNHRDARVAQASAKDILNRILGEPTKRIEERSDKHITILGITASAQQLENLRKPIITGETEPASADLTPLNKKDDVQVEEV